MIAAVAAGRSLARPAPASGVPDAPVLPRDTTDFGPVSRVFSAPVPERLTTPQISDNRGLAVICIDGLGFPALQYAVKAGHMPNLAGLMHEEGWNAQHFFPGIPCTTPASMLGFTLGDNSRIPSYYWYNKQTGENYSAGDYKTFHEGFEAPAEEAGNPGLVSKGSLHSCLASGGTEDAHMSIDMMSRRYQEGGTRSVLAYTGKDVGRFAVRHPIQFVRTVGRFSATTARNLKDSFNGKNGGFEHAHNLAGRVGVALTQSVETELCANAGTAGIADDMKAGKPSMFIDIATYDGTAHAYGAYSPEAMKALERVDRNVGKLMQQSEKGRGYEVVFVSDHGQTDSIAFDKRYGQTLGNWVQDRIGSSDTVIEKPDGALDNLYLTSDTKQLQLQDVEDRYPGLVDEIVAHPGVSMVVMRDGDATWAFGKNGILRIHGDQAEQYGEDILSHYGSKESIVAEQLHALAQMPNAGDILVFGDYLGHEKSVAFDDDPGGHGGLGGGQNQSIFITEPDRHIDTSSVTNSSQMYWALRDMLPTDGRPN